MRVITETELREQYKQAEFTSFQLPAGTKLTPSAQQFLSERRIKLLAETRGITEDPRGKHLNYTDIEGGFLNLTTGDKLAEKPEHMTHIRGNALVQKNHPRIKYRGKLDSLEALLISAVIEADSHGYRELAGDLGELLEYSRQIMSAEVKGEPLTPLTFRGLSAAEIREHSHHPRRFYHVSHLLPQPSMGRLLAQLNFIRTQCRELELAAMDAFYGQPEGEERPDILQSLNRLSSLVYVMMLQLTSGHYKIGS